MPADCKKPKRDLKIIPFNPASIFTDTVTAPGTSESEDSQTLRATPGSDSQAFISSKQEFLSLERGYKHYVPATSTSTPPQAHPPLTPPSPPPNPTPPSPAPPNPAPSSHAPPPPSSPAPPPPPPPPPPCLSPPLRSKSSLTRLAPVPSLPRGLISLPPGKPTDLTAQLIIEPVTVSDSEVPLACCEWFEVRTQ
ncbi:hypothetical protein BD769DRAFT_1390699 [Suillus cothurnatus]|nr:hypothetical protein BD769DRAFT_1390699 [Suillus cothurnatus]